MKKSCDLNSPEGCYEMGTYYHGGNGVKQNYKLAKECYRKSCDLSFQKGCDSLKQLTSQGF